MAQAIYSEKVIGTETLNISGLHRGTLTRPTRTNFWATGQLRKSVTARIYPAVTLFLRILFTLVRGVVNSASFIFATQPA